MSTLGIICGIIIMAISLVVNVWLYHLSLRESYKAIEKLQMAKQIHEATDVLNKGIEDFLKNIEEHIEREEAKIKPKHKPSKHPTKQTLYEFMPDTFTRQGVKLACELNGIKSPYWKFIHKWLQKGLIEQVIDAAGCLYKKTNHKN